MHYRMTLNIAPVAWGRVKRGRYGQAYVPPKTARFKRDLATLVRSQIKTNTPLVGSIRLMARFILTPPKKCKRAYPNVRPDLDNYLKAVKDGLNGVLWKDDGQIVHVDARKLYDMSGGGPRIEIEVEEIA